MKKSVSIILLAISVLVIILSGCSVASEPQEQGEVPASGGFTLIDEGITLSIYKENRTDVMYVAYHAGYGGGLTVMLDVDGKPLTYENWKQK